ncbi:MAG: hypothetical protein LBM13_06470 [Candidatus Ancillula sp.]|jgi:hypothetical protein|nr:hypothetical protein [Candidatus Ancillula sp.]
MDEMWIIIAYSVGIIVVSLAILIPFFIYMDKNKKKLVEKKKKDREEYIAKLDKMNLTDYEKESLLLQYDNNNSQKAQVASNLATGLMVSNAINYRNFK